MFNIYAMRIISFLFLIIAGTACFRQKSEYKNPEGYDLSKPERFKMVEGLTEISGLAFHNGNPDTVFAEQDEEGRVFYFRLGDKTASFLKFGKHGDYEDIAILKDQFVLLRSDGVLFTFPFSELKKDKSDQVKEWDNMLPQGEYEGIHADNATGQLYVLCKHCAEDKTSKQVSGHILQWTADAGFKPVGNFSIDIKTVEKLIGVKKINFHPSGLAKNPATGEWYIISSVNKLLLVTAGDWQVKQVFRLDPSLFPQPEGIAFDNQNNLYISNEGDEISKGTILKFRYRKK